MNLRLHQQLNIPEFFLNFQVQFGVPLITDISLFGNYYGDLRTNFGALTYNGKLQFMNMTDKNMKMDPQQLLDLVVQEIQLQNAESKFS